MEFGEHTNKIRISWNPFHPQSFVSGSVDSKILTWDLRSQKSTGQFDQMNVVKRKHVAYDPLNENYFAVGV